MNTLQLHIWKDDSIINIQEKFSDLFPFLWIKIFKHVGINKANGQNIMFCPEVKMSEINSNFKDGKLMVSSIMTVSELEQTFYDKFGLFVQVSRKNGSQVTESSLINNFILKETKYQEYKDFPAYVETVYFRQDPVGC
jgi:hypothetical protein